MTNSIIAAGGVVIAALGMPSTADGPVWDKYAGLICRDDSYVLCRSDGGPCERSAGQAMFTFDFAKGRFRSLGSTREGTIDARSYSGVPTLLDVPDAGTIFLSWGIAVTFQQPKKGRVEGASDEVKAIGQSAVGGDSSTRFMTCRPA